MHARNLVRALDAIAYLSPQHSVNPGLSTALVLIIDDVSARAKLLGAMTE
ncbi:MAG: hypothetical protein LBC97_02930 [Bifidobacteriaceae bacterium]|nr:hypothetical protein [Bifidobacteriaceae bacterium]